jgi:hypothetical protein
MFEYAYDLAGTTFPIIKEYDVANTQAIKKGELVRLTSGYIVPAGTDYTTPYFGLAAQDKTASDGTVRMKVYCSPTAVFKTDPITTVVTASPSTTVWTDSTVLLNTTSNSGAGGKLKITAKGASATGTFSVGTVVPITATATNSLTGAAASFPGSTAVGDTGLWFPAIGALGATAAATNATGIVWAATAGTALQVIDHDLIGNKIYFIIKLHQNSN